MASTVICINGNKAPAIESSQVVSQIQAYGLERCAKIRKLIDEVTHDENGLRMPLEVAIPGSPNENKKLVEDEARAIQIQEHLKACGSCRSYLRMSPEQKRRIDQATLRYLSKERQEKDGSKVRKQPLSAGVF